MKRSPIARKTPMTRTRKEPMKRTAIRTKMNVTKVCPHCGEPFECPRSHAARRVYCSAECWGIVRRTRIERACEACGKAFSFAPSQAKSYSGAGRFCSAKCKGVGSRREGGRTADKKWRNAVLARDGHRCARCGSMENLHVHHVATRSQRPDLKHDPANGKVLCASDHQWVHWNPAAARAEGLLSDERYELATEARRATIAAVRRGNLDHLMADVLRLHDAGMKPVAIGRELGCSESPVRRLLNEAGRRPHPPRVLP